ncbi:hypothetical protein AVEN_80810-1 [Araneus ventricosus]|uniref:Uncharacterized protein n=1 Tax=Araneus ventricosus TaxID=182803 RepID=A0A4Y2JV19_ARAVE|nr:hypothetical protein AVEN_80810-1 [Araneus ventricosus]
MTGHPISCHRCYAPPDDGHLIASHRWCAPPDDGTSNCEPPVVRAAYLPDPRQPAYPQRCKALARTAGEGEPPSLRRNTVHPAPRQHLFFPRKWYKTPIGCECKNTIVNTNQYNKHT